MKKWIYIGYLGTFCLTIAGILPLASIDSKLITILPIFDNYKIAGSIWLWRDISAFVMTHYLIVITALIMIRKNISLGIIIAGILSILNMFFILLIVFMSQLKSEPFKNLLFDYNFGWIAILFGAIFIIITGIKIKKSQI